MNYLEEAKLRQRALRLLQMRAGGRYTSFEAGMLYQLCLDLGMKDERKGGIGAQERYWEGIVCSCFGDDEAKETLEKLLKNKKVLTRKEKRLQREAKPAK
ncbi:MAG: hypothetical protein NWF06_01870 [Candidatus Bathyarchaeota archaeon]|nr:hypothetical protein [Candidatus Bathyarchaeum sp.]